MLVGQQLGTAVNPRVKCCVMLCVPPPKEEKNLPGISIATSSIFIISARPEQTNKQKIVRLLAAMTTRTGADQIVCILLLTILASTHQCLAFSTPKIHVHPQYSSIDSVVALSLSSSSSSSSSNNNGNGNFDSNQRQKIRNESQQKKDTLMDLLSSIASNVSTPKRITADILSAARELEALCPTDEDDVLPELGGNWELVWTAQDKSSLEGSQSPLRNWINPLENQSYSNNPNGAQSSGRANPILPQNIQNYLEDMGILKQLASSNKENDSSPSAPVRSSQAIDLKNKRVRNVVSFEAKNPIRLPLLPFQDPAKGFLTVDVKFSPNVKDRRKIDVKFEACRLTLRNSPLDVKFPLGVIGPTGWLRTGYIDDDIRITRGHKGSVFILSRTAKKKSKPKE